LFLLELKRGCRVLCEGIFPLRNCGVMAFFRA
jgi:hypothetical protein